MPPFNSIYSHGFIRVAVCVPKVRVADPVFNCAEIQRMAEMASEKGAALALFPELCVSAYSNEDLFHQDALLESSSEAVAQLIKRSAKLTPVLIIGFPFAFEGKLFNCAAVIHKGQLLGLVPKSYLPNYREFYEKRQFTSGRHAIHREVSFLGEKVARSEEHTS